MEEEEETVEKTIKMKLDTIEEEESVEPIGDVEILFQKAREHMICEEYNELQEICNKVLQHDKDNYAALVMLAKSYNNSDRAYLLFRKASKVNPAISLAWLGLASYYHAKQGAYARKKLFGVYAEILKLQIDEEQTREIFVRVHGVGYRDKDNESIRVFIDYMDGQENKRLKQDAGTFLMHLLENDVPCKNEDISAASKALNTVRNTNSRDNFKILLRNIVKQHSCFSSAVKVMMKIDVFQNDPQKSWICKEICKQFIETHTFSNYENEISFNEMILGIENSRWARLLACMVLYHEGHYLTSYLNCVTIVTTAPVDDLEAHFIIDCLVMMENWDAVEVMISFFKENCRQRNIQVTPRLNRIMSKFLMLSRSKRNKFLDAIRIAKDVPFAQLGLLEFSALVASYGDISDVPESTFIEMGLSKEYQTEFKILALMKADNFNEAIILLKCCPENAINYSLLGKAYWNLQLFDEAEINLIKSAELYPHSFIAWYNLGSFYYLCNLDLHKAKKYLEKAFSYNKNHLDTIEYLSAIYDRLNLDHTRIEFLQIVKEINFRTHDWVFFQLGQLHFKVGNMEDSILHLQTSVNIRSQDASIHVWLGDVYYTRQLYDAALEAYSGALSLDQNQTASSYCLMRVASIHSAQHNYLQAITVFDRVLDGEPHNIVAIKGIAEAYIQMAQEQVSTEAFQYARFSLETCANFINLMQLSGINDSSLRLLYGDTLMLVTRLPNHSNYIYLEDEGEEIKTNKLELYELAIKYFVLGVKGKNPYALYKCSSACLAYFNATNRNSLCYASYNMSVMCVKLTPTSWENWNLLGKASYFLKKYEFAQHCFIKAITLARDISVPKAWCNLGALYLKLEQTRFANFCFSHGKSALPSYPQCWMGQGLLAEIIQDEGIRMFAQSSDPDNFRLDEEDQLEWNYRTTRIQANDTMPTFEYAMKEFEDVPNGIDIIKSFKSHQTNDAWVDYALAYLKEQRGTFDEAIVHYKNALFTEADFDNVNYIRMSLGQILMKVKKYDDALVIFQTFAITTLETSTSLANAYYKVGELTEAFSTYTDTLYHFCENDKQRIDILVTMANVMFRMRGMEEAQKLLFQAARMASKSVPNDVFGLIIPGLDEEYPDELPSDLQQYEEVNFAGFNLKFILTQVLHRLEFDLASVIVIRAVNEHPNNPIMWYCLAQIYLQESMDGGNVTTTDMVIYCAQKAVALSRNTEHSFRIGTMQAITSVAQLSANNLEWAQEIARSSLEEYPDDVDLWAALIMSVYRSPHTLRTLNWLKDATDYMRRLGLSRSFNIWLDQFNL